MALVKHNNNSISAITTPGQLALGKMTLIKEQTASSSSSISFVDGSSDVVLDSTYPIYLFKFINCHPSSDNVGFKFNMSADTGSNYNVTKTSSVFADYHYESGSSAALAYASAVDLAQSTSDQQISGGVGSDNDQSANGSLFIFSPSSTTFVKHFIAVMQVSGGDNRSLRYHTAGYGNTTSAVDAIQFKFASGNIDAGTIKLYGIKGS
tara:strand:- start:13 stop:636 length:624 start_codon:yes stop_codon:yes gene_type:complete